MNAHVELVKDAINTHWRGYKIRSALKGFIEKMKTLQKSMRFCVRLRRYIRDQIAMPMLWEIETEILGPVVGVPQQALEYELERHRFRWDPKQKFIEARRMTDLGHRWHALPFKADVPRHAGKVRMSTVSPAFDHGTLKATVVPSGVAGRRPGGLRTGKATARQSVQPAEKALDHARMKDKHDKHVSHPAMGLIEKYRLGKERKENLMTYALRENSDRFYHKYLEYKDQCKAIGRVWHMWVKDCRRIGPESRECWPPPPNIPLYPYELLKFDMKELRLQVLRELKKTAAGIVL